MTFDAHKDRTALRLQLFHNGFTPLANRRKMCLIKGWNTLDEIGRASCRERV